MKGLRCWLCERTFIEAVSNFQEQVLSDKEIDGDIKSMLIHGEKEFIPVAHDVQVGFVLADVKDNYAHTGPELGKVTVWLCPVCSGILGSMAEQVNAIMEEKVSKEELENVTIKINRRK